MGTPPRRRNATAEDLIDACRGRIASYKIPRYWKFVVSFPMTVTGKTQKGQLSKSCECSVNRLAFVPVRGPRRQR